MRPSKGRPRRFVAILAAILAASFAFIAFAMAFASTPAGEGPALAAVETQTAQTATPSYLAETEVAAPGLQLRPPESGKEETSGSSLAGGQMAQIRWDEATGTPAFITGPITTADTGSAAGNALAFLSANRELFRMSDPAAEYSVARQQSDAMGMVHVQMAQVYKGVPVFGSQMGVHFNADGKIQTVNGRYTPGIALSVEPDVSVDAAVATALKDFGGPASPSAYEPPQLVVLAPGGTQSLLAWKVTLANDDPPVRSVFFVDAHSGAVVSGYDALEYSRNRKTYTANNGTSLPGTLAISEGGSSTDAVIQAAHDNAGATYDYYYSTFGRDSYNNSGAALTSTVHYSNGYNNAYWNGQQVVFGDGDGNVFSPLGSGKDVVAHELTHALTQYTADLVYSYQSGALNESYSDVFGAMVDRDDWLMGEDVYTPHTPGDALRSLSNPAQYGQPDHMNSYVNTSSDNGGVHTNSGIPNKAAYNIATAIGREKTERIWYRTLTVYLNSGSEFNDARDASVQAATDLYGPGSAEVVAVQNGFSAVGIGAGQTSNQTARIEINHSYRGDLVVTLGVGNPDSPVWSTIVSNRSGGSADNLYTTVDIAAAAAQLPPSWQNRWYLKVYDAAGQDTGSITKFAITDNGSTFTATDTPITVSDFATVYSYVPSTDDVPPTVLSVSPANGATAYSSVNVFAFFSENIAQGTLTGSSFTVSRHDTGAPVSGTISYDQGTGKATFDPAAALAYATTYDAVITTAVTDIAGNHLAQNYQWSFTTSPAPKLYYFTWYDQQSPGMKDWVVMGNPASEPGAVNFDVYIGGQKANGAPLSVAPANSRPASFAGAMGGPIRAESLDGKNEIISKRTLYGESFEEITALSENRLDDKYYFTWYDSISSRDWVLIANPGDTAVEADVYIAGRKMNSSPYQVAPGAYVTPEYGGVMGGPVVVVGHEPGSPSTPRDIIASQRVLWDGNFNEVMGIPSAELESEYMFTWYDNLSAGSTDWVLIGNSNSDKVLAAEVWIGGQRMADPATGRGYFLVPPGGSATPRFPGVMAGPVVVRGFDAAGYVPDSQQNVSLNFYSTQRCLFGPSFEEVTGYGVNRLTNTYHYSWYDQASVGSRNWVLVSNPTSAPVTAEIWIAGGRMAVLTIAPGATQTPTFPGVMSGPVEVRGYDSATYNPANPGSPNRAVFTSQRVFWNGHFNEVEGMSLD